MNNFSCILHMRRKLTKQCLIAIVDGNLSAHYRLNKGFYRLVDMSVDRTRQCAGNQNAGVARRLHMHRRRIN